MRVPDSLLIPALIFGEMWRRFSRRLRSGPLYSWRFSGSVPTRQLAIPQDLRPTDPQKADDIYSGHYTFNGETLSTSGETPFASPAPSDGWYDQLHRFRWLRHHRAADTELARANAIALITDWIELWGNQLGSSAWRSDIVAARLVSWFCHTPHLADDMGPTGKKMLLRSMAKQTRYLQLNAPHMRDGYPRLLATIALAYASLCLSGREKVVKSAGKDLDRELDRQILPDGGHISRNPVVLIHLLADLLPLNDLYQNHGSSASAKLGSAIDRMLSALRFFGHSNGELAQFNGTGQTPHELMENVVQFSTARGEPQRSAPQSGYERMSAGKTVVLIDTGKPAGRTVNPCAMAGTLSFELSRGPVRFIANCGVPEISQQSYMIYARATAAHSTATIDDNSSSRFAGNSSIYKMLPSPLVRGPDNVTCKRVDEGNHQAIEASHDGYRHKYGVIHKRELALSGDGSIFTGCDSFLSTKSHLPDSLVAAVRFHLPASVNVSKLTSGHSILIAAPNNEAWIFTCIDAEVVLEESIQFSGPGHPRKSEQIVVYVQPGLQSRINWSLEHRAKKNQGQGKRKSVQRSPAPDLLDPLEQNEADRP